MPDNQQLTLELACEPGLDRKYRDQRECFAVCVYRRGLGNVAAACDVAPSNLSQMLSGSRHLDTEIIERYMAAFKDPTPALFWAARFGPNPQDLKKQALIRAQELLPGLLFQVKELLESAGMSNEID